MDYPALLAKDLADDYHRVWGRDQIIAWIKEAVEEALKSSSAGTTYATFPVSDETGEVVFDEFVPKTPISLVDVHGNELRKVFLGNEGRIKCGSRIERTACGYKITPSPPFGSRWFLRIRGADVINLDASLRQQVSQWVIFRATQMDSGVSDVAEKVGTGAITTYMTHKKFELQREANKGPAK